MEDKKLILQSLDDIPEVEEKTAVILPDGREGFLHPSGSIRNNQGHYIVKPPWANRAWTGEDTRGLIKIREEKRREAVVNAILAGTGAGDIGAGLQKLSEALVAIILEGKQDRDRITAYKELLRHGGMSYDLGRGSMAEGSGAGSGLTGEALEALNVILPYLERRIRGSDDV